MKFLELVLLLLSRASMEINQNGNWAFVRFSYTHFSSLIEWVRKNGREFEAWKQENEIEMEKNEGKNRFETFSTSFLVSCSSLSMFQPELCFHFYITKAPFSLTSCQEWIQLYFSCWFSVESPSMMKFSIKFPSCKHKVDSVAKHSGTEWEENQFSHFSSFFMTNTKQQKSYFLSESIKMDERKKVTWIQFSYVLSSTHLYNGKLKDSNFHSIYTIGKVSIHIFFTHFPMSNLKTTKARMENFSWSINFYLTIQFAKVCRAPNLLN